MDWETIKNVGEIVALIAGGITALAVGLGYAYAKFKQGGATEKRETIDTESSTLSLLQQKVGALTKLVEDKDKENKDSSEANRQRNEGLAREISRLQGQIEEKDKKIKEYLEIIQNRDPQLLTVLKDLHALMARIETQLNGHKVLKGKAKK